MRAAFVIAIAGPVLAAAAIQAFADVSRMTRSVLHTLGLAAALGALGFIAGSVWVDGSAEAASFSATGWQIVLAAGVLLATLTSRARGMFEQVCILAAASAGVGSVLSSDVVSTAAFLVVTTIALAASSRGPGSMRWASALAISDLLAIGGLLWAAEWGLRSPPSPGTGPAVLLVAAGVLRIAADRGIQPGVARCQGLLLCVWGLAPEPAFAPALGLAVAVAAAGAAHRSWAVSSRHAALAAEALIVVALLSVGTVEARWAAALLATGAFVAVSRPAAGSFLALAATVPGLIAAAVATLGVDDDLLVMGTGVLVTMAAGWLVLARVTGRAAPLAAGDVVPMLLTLALLVIPGTIAAELGARVAPAFGGGPPLSTQNTVLPDAAGAAFVAALIGVSLVVRPARPSFARFDGDAEQHAQAAPNRWLLPTFIIEAASVACFLALLIVGMRRGFL